MEEVASITKKGKILKKREIRIMEMEAENMRTMLIKSNLKLLRLVDHKKEDPQTCRFKLDKDYLEICP